MSKNPMDSSGKGISSSPKVHRRQRVGALPIDEYESLAEKNGSDVAYGVTRKGKEKGHDDKDALARSKVREALRLFQVLYRIFLRDREQKGRGYRNGDAIENAILKIEGICVNERVLGPIRGVEVGDQFRFKAELLVVGLHCDKRKGIDYLRKGPDASLGTSLLVGDELNMGSSEVFIYSVEGGIPSKGKKQAKDQHLSYQNALENSKNKGNMVRVIRGLKEKLSKKTVSTFIYMGLYLVQLSWETQRTDGTKVYNFQLRRMSGQQEIPFEVVKKLKASRINRAVVGEEDISQNLEYIRITSSNMVDKDKSPPPFNYKTRIRLPLLYHPTFPTGCQCTDGCLDPKLCSCAVRNGGEMPFNFNGDIVCAKPLVYACGPMCKCPPSCYNKVSDQKIKFEFDIFKTESRGWGVRSWNFIPSGSFICEYAGELLEKTEADKRKKSGQYEYMFDIGDDYKNDVLYKKLSKIIPPDLQSKLPCETAKDAEFTIDARKRGSVGRFINHSCSPNLFAQNVLYDHNDKRFPHVMFYAAEHIPPLRELTIRYNVHDSDDQIKKKDCHCGSHNCSGRLY